MKNKTNVLQNTGHEEIHQSLYNMHMWHESSALACKAPPVNAIIRWLICSFCESEAGDGTLRNEGPSWSLFLCPHFSQMLEFSHTSRVSHYSGDKRPQKRAGHLNKGRFCPKSPKFRTFGASLRQIC